jgi:uncharacterized glyoxalase superfamily protein PhnB
MPQMDWKLELVPIPVSDVDAAKIHAARAQLVERGVEVSDVQELGAGIFFVFLKDPDGNSWAIQRVAPEARRPQGDQQ